MSSRLTTISFFGIVDARSNLTLVSKRVGYSFCVKRIMASFAPGVDRLMNLYFFVSPDKTAPTDARPNGTNILAQHGQVSYISGDDERKEFSFEALFPERGYYLKVFAVNNDTFEHTIDAQITVELLIPKKHKE